MATAALFKNAKWLRAEEDRLSALVQRDLVTIRKQLTDLIAELPLDGVSPGFQLRRLAALTARSDAIIEAGYARLNSTVTQELVALGQQQGAKAAERFAQLAQLDSVRLALPTKAMMRAILTSDPVQGSPMKEWWQEQSRVTARAFRTQMRIGLTRQEGVADLMQRVRGTRTPSGDYTGGLMPATARGAEALVRTTVNQVANAAAIDAYSSDPAVSEEFEFVATLDDRTTEECQAADGQVFRYDDPGALIPPLHWNCRSGILPVIKYAELGLTQPTEQRMTYKEWAATKG